ncbi:hypothetical protein V502_09489 [Pseudogymnoascus sp. VKM F-4520 (FW-2644)]|nr:hypothetical protein V502_09489 [Pseudogymnoascus sp. VKM F-4520 (FW-2644)]
MVLLSNVIVVLISDLLLAFVEARDSTQPRHISNDPPTIPNMVTGGDGPCIGNIVPIERLGFSGICMADGPTAYNRADLVSVFPAGLTAAASWDKDLIYQRALALGSEFRDKGSHVGLAPVGGPLGRHPLGGRNWEGFSTDPYLTGVAMASSVRGLQDAGVQSCSKHFIGNEQETQRSNSVSVNGTNIDAVSSKIDDRTLHELYLWPFADAVKAGTTSIMCSYNRVNQTYACENSELLNGILKKELGFQGYVVSDWSATHSGVKSINAGLDMTMPGSLGLSSLGTGDSYFGGNLTAAVNNGSVPMARVDDMIRRIMMPYYFLGQDKNFPTPDPSAMSVLAAQYGVSLGPEIPARDVRRDHAKLIRKLGAAGTVLLKNVNSALPLKSPKNIGVFGNDAPDPTDGLTIFTDGAFNTKTYSYDTGSFDSENYGPDIGTLDVGGGSGSGRHSYLISPLEAIKAKAQKTGARVQYLTSNTRLAANDFRSIFPTPEVCIVFLKTFASESRDRLSFENDWNSTLVVNNVAKKCPNTIVVTHSGGVNTMPWANNPNVTAILAAHYPGQETGNSIVDLLWGDVNPSGKLPYTIPEKESDYDIPVTNLSSVTSADEWQSDFTEGLMIDYRHFDAKNITPLYEFGHGLSYTIFDISLFSISKLVKKPTATPATPKAIVPGGNPDIYMPLLTASTKVSNTGPVDGSTVVQLYVSLPQDSVPAGTPVRVLRGFEKVSLKQRQTTDVRFTLTRRDVSYWDVVDQTWRIPKGDIKLTVGFSSRDFKGTGSVTVLSK